MSNWRDEESVSPHAALNGKTYLALLLLRCDRGRHLVVRRLQPLADAEADD